MSRQLIISCEHAGNEVPPEYRYLFESDEKILKTHRGLDIGALELTRTIEETLQSKAYMHTISRLLVDLNRSLNNPTLFSEYTISQPEKIRKEVVEKYYQPHRRRVENRIRDVIYKGDQAIHLSVHTFTPELNGRIRDVDIGFLYDPSRSPEREFCQAWRKELSGQIPDLCLRMNNPYKGTMDGFSTHLRKKYSADSYLGIELEVNQRFPQSDKPQKWNNIQSTIARSLHKIIAG